MGAAATAIATVVFILTKFTEGAWVVVVAVPAFIFMFTRINRYYRRVGRELGLGAIPGRPQVRPAVVVVPVPRCPGWPSMPSGRPCPSAST